VWLPEEQALYWVDIRAPMIWRMLWPGQECRSWMPPFRISALAPRRQGGFITATDFIAATDKGFAFIDPEAGDYRLIAAPEASLPGNRSNDGKVDRAGNFWFGTMDDAEQAETGALYRVAADLSWRWAGAGYKVPNGPAFSRDGGTIYHTDSARRSVYKCALNEDGTLGERTIFLSFSHEDGYPDGMTVDAEDCLWIAFWDGWCVRRFAPDGAPLARIPLPVQRPTSCAFGGPDLDLLFITSARFGLSDHELSAQPLAGSLFVVSPGCRGVAEHRFAG
jgi:sugar lactone lactonase YvrE